MPVGHRINELHIDAHLIVRFLYAAFKNVHYPELLRDVTQVRWRTLKTLRRSAGDDF